MNRPQSYLVVLEHLAERVRVRLDRQAANEGIRAALSSPATDPLEVIATAGRRTGVGCRILDLTVRDAISLIGSDAVIVTATSTGEWRLLIDRRGRRVAVDTVGAHGSPVWKSLNELEQDLGRDGTRRWAVVEPDLACSLAEATPSSTGPVAPLPPLMRLLRLFRPDLADVVAVVLFAVVIGGLLLATPIAVQTLVNVVAVGGSIPPLVILSLLLLAGLSGAALLTGVQTWIVEVLQRRIFVRMVADLAHRLPRVSFGVHDRHYGPELVNRFFDVITIQKVSSLLLLDGLSTVLSVVVGLVVLAFYHPILLAFDLVLLVAVNLVVFAPARWGVKSAIAESKAKYAVACWLEEIARNPLTFKSRAAEDFVVERADVLAREYVIERKRHYRILFGQIVSSLGLQVIASAVLLGVGGFLVIAGELSLGQLVAAELIVTVVVGSVAKMGKHLEGFYDLMAAVDKLGNLLDLPLEPRGGVTKPAPTPPVGGASVRLDGVVVRGPSGDPLLDEISLSVAAGERVGLPGGTRRPASILAQLLYGVRRADQGVIEIDGCELREIGLDELRRDVAVVAQPEVFEGTIWENVTLGCPEVSVQAARKVLDRLGLLEEFSALPHGLQTRLQPGGSPLSHDQAIRVLLARAIVCAPRLLIVDGLLDRLSARSLAMALDVVADPAAAWTLIVISNRERVLASCDRRLELPPPATVSAVGAAGAGA